MRVRGGGLGVRVCEAWEGEVVGGEGGGAGARHWAARTPHSSARPGPGPPPPPNPPTHNPPPPQVYKRVLDKPVTEQRVAGVCQRENAFYVDTVRAFRCACDCVWGGGGGGECGECCGQKRVSPSSERPPPPTPPPPPTHTHKRYPHTHPSTGTAATSTRA